MGSVDRGRGVRDTIHRMADAPRARFLALADVAQVLNISVAQAYALVRRGDLPAIKVGGRGQWRVEVEALEAYIAGAYTSTAQYIKEHPFVGDESRADETADLD